MRTVFLLMSALSLFWACENDLKEIDALYSEEQTENEIVRDVEIIYTDQFVKITNPREVIYSYGFKADQNFTRYEVNQVKGRMVLDSFAF